MGSTIVLSTPSLMKAMGAGPDSTGPDPDDGWFKAMGWMVAAGVIALMATMVWVILVA